MTLHTSSSCIGKLSVLHYVPQHGLQMQSSQACMPPSRSAGKKEFCSHPTQHLLLKGLAEP